MKSSERSELRALTDAVLSGIPLTEQEGKQLDELLRDPAAREFYLQTVEIDTHLPGKLEDAEIIHELDRAERSPAWRHRGWLAAGIAAGLTFLLGWLANSDFRPAPVAENQEEATILGSENKRRPHAGVTSLIGVRWNETPASVIDPAVIDLASGLLELSYASGVKVIIEGPARYEVTGPNAGMIVHGRFAARVPPGAEGFSVSYASGKIVDLGTEFGCELSTSGKLQLGVFEGEVELHAKDSHQVVNLNKDHAVEQYAEAPDQISSIPFDRDSFVREAPSREFSWHLSSTVAARSSWDVSHLIWKPGTYFCVFKWMRGPCAAQVSDVSLWHDGRKVDSLVGQGTTGYLQLTADNVFHLNIPAEQYGRGKWTVQATLQSVGGGIKRVDGDWSQGVLLFEDGGPREAVAKDYVGTWSYQHDGLEWKRVFHGDGTIDLLRDGVLQSNFKDAKWTFGENSVRIWIPQLRMAEDVILRDSNTLIFTDQPYRNAVRQVPEK